MGTTIIVVGCSDAGGWISYENLLTLQSGALVGFTSASTDVQLLLPRERRNTSKTTKTPAPQARQPYLFCARKRKIICLAKVCAMTDVKDKKFFYDFVRERRASEARPKVCVTDIVRPHAAQLMIDKSVNQFCPSKQK